MVMEVSQEEEKEVVSEAITETEIERESEVLLEAIEVPGEAEREITDEVRQLA